MVEWLLDRPLISIPLLLVILFIYVMKKIEAYASQEPKPRPRPAPEPAPEPRFKLGDGFYWEFDEVPNGYGGYRIVSAFLLRQGAPFFRRCIVDAYGNIQHFPGFQEGSWRQEMTFPVDSTVRFGFWISAFRDGKASVRWTLQPDGRYFEDEDGFGAEHCEEVTLYASLDQNGHFTGPFGPEA